MKQLEIEFKILLTPKVYHQIVKDYQNQIKADYWQTNYYLIHPKLDQYGFALRIREKNKQYELTLKTPAKIGKNEYNVPIDQNTKEKIFHHEKVHNEIFDILKKYQINYQELQALGYLTTHRLDIPFQEGILSLDDNQYNGYQDYELEFEVYDVKLGLNKFYEIIKPYHLVYQNNCLGKIQRFKSTITQ